MKYRIILFSACLFPFGCSSSNDGNGDDKGDTTGGADGDADNDADGDADSDGDTGTNGNSDGDTDTDTDTDSDTDADSDTGDGVYTNPIVPVPDGGDICADWDLRINFDPARLMILQDLSSSMGQGGNPNKWEQARSALISLVNTYGFSDLLEIGLDVFPDRRDCIADEPVVLDAKPESGQKVYDVLARLELSQSTPLAMAMENFLNPGYAPVFSSPDMERYLIIVSDGMDSCGFESNHSPSSGGGATAAQLGALAKQLYDDQGIVTIPIGFGTDADPDQLNAIIRNGGSSYDEYFVAGDRAELETVFNEIAAYAIDCTFEVDPEVDEIDGESLDMDKVNFKFDGGYVGYDKDCENGTGWTFTDETRTTVEFCDAACRMIKDGEVQEISAVWGCEGRVIIVV